MPLVGRDRVGDREVVPDGRVEQVDVLRHDAEQRADLVAGHLADLPATDPDLAVGVVAEPEQEAHRVDFPTPLGPTMARLPPGGTLRSRPSSASGSSGP